MTATLFLCLQEAKPVIVQDFSMRRFCTRVYSAIGHLRIDKITPRHVQAFINSLSEKDANMLNGNPLSLKAIRHYHRFISEVFTYGERRGVVSKNPCEKVSCQRYDTRKSRYTHQTIYKGYLYCLKKNSFSSEYFSH